MKEKKRSYWPRWNWWPHWSFAQPRSPLSVTTSRQIEHETDKAAFPPPAASPSSTRSASSNPIYSQTRKSLALFYMEIIIRTSNTKRNLLKFLTWPTAPSGNQESPFLGLSILNLKLINKIRKREPIIALKS